MCGSQVNAFEFEYQNIINRQFKQNCQNVWNFGISFFKKTRTLRRILKFCIAATICLNKTVTF